MNIRPPCITGQTTDQRLEEVIGYLRQLPKALSQEETSVRTQPQSLPGTMVLHRLQVRDALTAGSINGICPGRKRVWGSREFQLQSRFSHWNSEDVTWQSFLICGSSNGTPVLGTAVVDSHGGAAWEGSAGVSVTTGQGGIVTVTLAKTCYDYFQITSPEPFRVL